MWEERTRVEGAEALAFKVIKMSDYSDAHIGPLLEADTMTGAFSYKDKTGETRHANFGPHSIKIIPRK